MDEGFSARPVKARIVPTTFPIPVTGHINGRATERTAARAPQLDWSTIDDGAHFVQFYEVDTYLLDAVGSYITASLRRGDAGIIVATRTHCEGVEQRLQQAGLDIDQLKESGQLIVRDAFETLTRFMVEGMPDAGKFNESVGQLIASTTGRFRRTRVFGGMVALLVADGNYPATLALERLWNDLQRSYPFSLFCAYPMDYSGSEALVDLFNAINATHTHVIPAESYSALDTDDDRLRAIADLQQKARWLETEVAQRKQAEERLRVALAAERAARQEAEVAVRQRNEFFSIAAHELKTPLTSLSGQAQLALRHLRRGNIDPARIMRSTETIVGQAQRLTVLINRLLDVSRLEAGKLALDVKPVDLTALVTAAVAAVQPTTDQHQIVLSVPDRLYAQLDPLRIEQVITNLLDNAIKYSPNGGDIEVTLAEQGQDEVELTVRDHGIGLPPGSETQIFERFSHVPRAGQTSGMGLGLFISRQVVELHGGRIEATLPDDGGVRIRLRLPRNRDAAPESPSDG